MQLPSERSARKVVSVLFVDLVGLTSRSDRADPEDARATLRPYRERVKVDIERFGGTVGRRPRRERACGGASPVLARAA
ncbi:MAG: hypothetical protein ACRDPV_00470 [Gaiellaceae bacterium]